MRYFLLLSVWVALSAFTSQPLDERKAQDTLPQARDNLWNSFAQCNVALDAKHYTYSIQLTPEVKAMAGKSLTVSGFMLPLEAKEKFTHFLLSKRTPTCPFCPPGEPNEVVEVFTKTPVKWDDGLVVVTGTMALINEPDMGLFFRLNDSSLSAPPREKQLTPPG